MTPEGITKPSTIAAGVDQRFGWHKRLLGRPLPTVGRLAHGSAQFSSLIGRPLSVHSVFRGAQLTDARSVPDLPRVVGHPYLQLWRVRSLAEELDPSEVTTSPRSSADRSATDGAIGDRAIEELRERSAGVLPRVTRGVHDGFAPGSGLLRLQRDVLPVRLLPDVAAVGPVLTAREHSDASREAQNRPRSSAGGHRRFRPPALASSGIPARRWSRAETDQSDEQSPLAQASTMGGAHGPSTQADRARRDNQSHEASGDSSSGLGGVNHRLGPSGLSTESNSTEFKLTDQRVVEDNPNADTTTKDNSTKDNSVEFSTTVEHDHNSPLSVDAQLPALGLESVGIDGTQYPDAGGSYSPDRGGGGSNLSFSRSPEDELLAMSTLLFGGLGSSYAQVKAARDGAAHIDQVGPFWQYSSQFPRTSFVRGADNFGVVGARLRVADKRFGREDRYRDAGRTVPGFERTIATDRRAGGPHLGTREGLDRKHLAGSSLRLGSRGLSGNELSSSLASTALGQPATTTARASQTDRLVATRPNSSRRGRASNRSWLREFRDRDGHSFQTDEGTKGLHLGTRLLPMSANFTPRIGGYPRSVQRFNPVIGGTGLSGIADLGGDPAFGEAVVTDSSLASRMRPIRPRSFSIVRRPDGGPEHTHQLNPITDMMRRQSRFVEALGGASGDVIRPLPAALEPLAKALGITRPIKIRTGPATASALGRAKRPAATYRGVIHLQRDPDLSPASVELVAHELVHAAAEPKSVADAPRFFRDDRLDVEEGRARAVGSLAAGMVGETGGRRGGFAAVANLDRLPVIGRSRMARSFGGQAIGQTMESAETGNTAQTSMQRSAKTPAKPVEDDSTKALRALFDRFRASESHGASGDSVKSSVTAMPPAPPFAGMSAGQSAPGMSLSAAHWSPLSTAVAPQLPVPHMPATASSVSIAAHHLPLTDVLESQGIRSTQGDHTMHYESHVVDSSSAPKAEEFLDWLVEQVERRVLREMEAQGHRHMPDVL